MSRASKFQDQFDGYYRGKKAGGGNDLDNSPDQVMFTCNLYFELCEKAKLKEEDYGEFFRWLATENRFFVNVTHIRALCMRFVGARQEQQRRLPQHPEFVEEVREFDMAAGCASTDHDTYNDAEREYLSRISSACLFAIDVPERAQAYYGLAHEKAWNNLMYNLQHRYGIPLEMLAEVDALVVAQREKFKEQEAERKELGMTRSAYFAHSTRGVFRSLPMKQRLRTLREAVEKEKANAQT